MRPSRRTVHIWRGCVPSRQPGCRNTANDFRPESDPDAARYDKIVGARSHPSASNQSMIQPTYPAARLVADAVGGHFARHVAAARAADGASIPDSPPPLAVASIIDAAFWASLRREEGQTPKISLAFLSPEQARHPLTFASRLPLAPAVLSKVAPAVERPGIHLGVWQQDDEFFVWGTT